MSLIENKKKFNEGALSKDEYIRLMHAHHAQLFEYAELLKKNDIANIEITADRVTMTARSTGVRIECTPFDRRLAPIEALNFGFYEKEDSDMIYRVVEDGFNVFDVGANIGWYSIGIAKLFSKCRVYAFEPVTPTFLELKKNIELNQTMNVFPYPLGFSDRKGEATIYFDASLRCGASLADVTTDNTSEKIVCPLERLDEFVEREKVRPDFIKCDVEGAEWLVYKGASQTLRNHKPMIFSEMLRKWCKRFNYHPNDIIDFLSGLGYSCFTAKSGKLSRFGRMNDETLETNFFFLHQDKHQAKIISLESPSV